MIRFTIALLTAGSNNRLKGRISEYTAGRIASRQKTRFRLSRGTMVPNNVIVGAALLPIKYSNIRHCACCFPVVTRDLRPSRVLLLSWRVSCTAGASFFPFVALIHDLKTTKWTNPCVDLKTQKQVVEKAKRALRSSICGHNCAGTCTSIGVRRYDPISAREATQTQHIPSEMKYR